VQRLLLPRRSGVTNLSIIAVNIIYLSHSLHALSLKHHVMLRTSHSIPTLKFFTEDAAHFLPRRDVVARRVKRSALGHVVHMWQAAHIPM
jgi:hypothetical protein